MYTSYASVHVVYIASRAASDPINALTRGAAAYEQIRAMIFEGKLAAGTHVTEAALVRLLDMSRTPIREALARLATEGQLIAAPGRGFVVVEVRPADLIDVYAVRARLEGLAAENAAARLTRVDLARLEDLYDAMEDARGRDADSELAVLNSEFHRVIAQAAGNVYLEAMLDDIREVFDRFRTTALALPGRRDDAHREHGALIAALRAQDAAVARGLAEEHVHRALDARRGLLESVRAEPDQRRSGSRRSSRATPTA